MRSHPFSHALLVAALVTGLLGCNPSTPDTPAPQALEIQTLEPAEVAHLADSIRQDVAVQVADGLQLHLWAPEPLVADPIALHMDDHGRAYITRTHRQKHSEFDIRGHRDWMLASIAFRSVEDRRAFLHTELAPELSDENTWLEDLNGDGSHDWRDLTVEQEEVYRIEDTGDDGLADRSQLVIRGFNTEVTDVAGAVLAYDDALYLGVAPDLWRLRDTDGDGMADEQTSISHGYAVHIGFGGHGMSGLTVGPDGRIYWGIGDIGMRVVDDEGREWAYPNQGVIVRADPDGSNFEVFAAGLRNTHEFVFDEYGNLISVDNDGDHPGEHERLVYVVNGSDSGWRTNWQFGKYIDPDNNGYKVWMDEGLFQPRFEGQAAYITPPIAAYHSGPAGMAYNPGTALGDSWRNHFFVAEFTGSPARSRVFAFRLRPEGAGFAFVEEKEAVRGILATGVEFGPDGALYVADWLDGWDTKDRGRIWKLDDSTAALSPIRDATQGLLAASFDPRSDDDLAGLLRHDDMRVRQKAQFALADRGATDVFLAAAEQTDHQLARVHGLWGLTQLIRRGTASGDALVPFLEDTDPEIRAQAAKMLGDIRHAEAGDALMSLLQDDAPRVRFFAAEALGRIAHTPAVQPILDMLEANDEADVYLRHAGAAALARIGEAEPLIALSDHPSRALRIAAVVALRRLRDPGVARFLEDADPYLVTEAARAINDDGGIEAALPALAAVLQRDDLTGEPLLRRAINAALRLGTTEHAEAVAAYAARGDAPEAMRVEALAALGVWPEPSVVDRVDGRHRGPVTRDPSVARAAVTPMLEPLLQRGSPALQVAAAETAGRLEILSAAPTLADLATGSPSPEARVAALSALATMAYDGTDAVVRTALDDPDATVRMAALGLIPDLDVPEPRRVELLTAVLDEGTAVEQQAVVAALGRVNHPEARAALGGLIDRLEAGSLPPEIHLELAEAVASDTSGALAARLETARAAAPEAGGEVAYRDVLLGGDEQAGARIFYRHESAQCIRCHAVGDQGGDVGPNLAGIASLLTREQLVEALLDPGARIAPGFGAVTLTLSDGRTVTGVVRDENDARVVLVDANGETEAFPVDTITERRDAPSGMPPMNALLTRRELRDVVAFLATLE